MCLLWVLDGAMAIRSDTSGIEKNYLLDMLAVRGCRILEVGCGDGRLLWQYAGLSAAAIGIDPDAATLQRALPARPAPLAPSTALLAASAIDLPFAAASFDHILFAWSF